MACELYAVERSVLLVTNMLNTNLIREICFSYSFSAYKDRHGNIEVPAGYTMPNGKKLDQWILRQRRLFTEGKLPAELINKLENLDMNLKGRGRPFGLDSPEWFDRYKELLDYFTKHGDCDVPDNEEHHGKHLIILF